MKKLVSALLVSTAISAPAFAIGFDQPVGPFAVADLGFISYGGLGSALALNVGGGYQFHPALGVEVDYLMGSNYNYGGFLGNYSTSLSSLQFNAVGTYSATNELAFFGKLGLALNSEKVTQGCFAAAGVCTYTYSTTDLAFAFGAKYKLSKELAVRAQYQETGVSAFGVFSVGAQYNF